MILWCRWMEDFILDWLCQQWLDSSSVWSGRLMDIYENSAFVYFIDCEWDSTRTFDAIWSAKAKMGFQCSQANAQVLRYPPFVGLRVLASTGNDLYAIFEFLTLNAFSLYFICLKKILFLSTQRYALLDLGNDFHWFYNLHTLRILGKKF